MNENIDLTKILKDCPEGFPLYSTIYGNVTFLSTIKNVIEFIYSYKTDYKTYKYKSHVNLKGNPSDFYNGECTLFPSKEQRDWSKFLAPWYKKGKFDPKTLQPFDKVLIRRGSENYNVWFPDFVSDPPNGANNKTLCMCVGEDISMVIPYNEETKHLVGTTDDAPEYYRYWEE